MSLVTCPPSSGISYVYSLSHLCTWEGTESISRLLPRPSINMYSVIWETGPKPIMGGQLAFKIWHSDNSSLNWVCPFSFLCLLNIFETMSLWLCLSSFPWILCTRFPGLAAVCSFDLGHLPRHRRPQSWVSLSVQSQCQQPLGNQPSKWTLRVCATSRVWWVPTSPGPQASNQP
jgi:hypothetical protein